MWLQTLEGLAPKTKIKGKKYGLTNRLGPDMKKKNSMNSVEFNYLKDFPPNLLIFPPNFDP